MVATAILFLNPETLSAKDWKGATPGVTTRQAVISKFGKPAQELSKGGKFSNGINYQGKQKIPGSKQANFFFDKYDVLFQIDVFPKKKITKGQVISIFGKDFLERLTKKGHVFFNYQKDGLIIFFQRDSDLVLTFMFIEESTAKKENKK